MATKVRFETTLTPETIQKYTNSGAWKDHPLLAAFESAVAKTPDKTAIVAPDGSRLTYAETQAIAETIARNLHNIGVGRGDVISMQLPNCAEFVLVHLAALRLGAVTNPLLPNYRTKELSYILKFAGSKICIIPDRYRGFDYLSMHAHLRSALPELGVVYVRGSNVGPGMESFADLTKPASGSSLPELPRDCNQVSLLVFTSGTESTPKGVMHSENTMMYGTLTMASLLNLTADDVVWTPSPLGHGTAFQWGMRQAFTLGATVVLQDIWDPLEGIKLIARERCTYTLAATPFAAMLLECPDIDKHDLSSFRIFACAGAPIPEQLGNKFRDRIDCTLIGMWGMTECFVGSASPPDDREAKLWLTDGKAMPGGAELGIFDERRTKMLPPGQAGELATRGPHVALGYFNDPLRTESTFRKDGWLFSNDLATIDAEGYIRLVGRTKDIINRGGIKISVREIEEMLLAHGAFRAVAVVAVPDSRLGEKSCAFVICRLGRSASFEEVITYLEGKGVAKYKLPEYFVPLQEFPMTASGKIQKFQLRDDFVKGNYDAAKHAVGAKTV
jgi:non-ribosomal peptide synthetase component E (peptide arylation enzyme)